ncbi:MAG: aminotransferase class I/II-fold pyridoxal phosphate-dependent enzyme [Actinobacteria bacterium]|nr:aminotransferase class I/II-fold pyridoxal phosphate-dependent enzyme [Actinomycetota bacterium]
MPDAPIDLRSDTVTRPTPGMRRAMADAEVGDDVYGEDPTVTTLEREVAERFGREAALFTPTGVMANQVALRVLAAPGTEVVLEAAAHIVAYEAGAHAQLGGLQFRTVDAPGGTLTAELVRAALRPPSFPYTTSALVCLEQTSNRWGGTVYDLDTIDGVRAVADEAGIGVYIDGARIWNASVAAGVPVDEYGRRADALMFSASKGLGCPVGSIVVGDRDLVDEARHWRRLYGGAMRQVGVLAAAVRYALEHHVDRLAEDHANARLIADVVAAAQPAAVQPATVATNMVYLDTGEHLASDLVAALGTEDGVLVGSMGPHLLRLVTHLDVDEAACRRAADAIARRLGA